MPERVLAVPEILEVLTANPKAIAAMTRGVSEDRLQTAAYYGEWSATDVVAHLRIAADLYGGYLVRILEEDHPTLRAANAHSPKWRIGQGPWEDFRTKFRGFKQQRADLLASLRALPEEGWWRSATVTGAGPATERSVHYYADRLARHERDHLRQIEQLMARTPT